MIHKLNFSKLLIVLLVTVSTSFANWMGDISEPKNTTEIDDKVFYEITTPEELAWFALQVNDGNTTINAQLQNDIVLWDSEVSDTSGTTRWNAIGDSLSLAFKGVFDGNGYKISGLYVNDTLPANGNTLISGFFGVVDTIGVVKNILIENAYLYARIDSTGTKAGNGFLGGIAGVNRGTIENVNFSGAVSIYSRGKKSSSYIVSGYAGGITGINYGTIAESTVFGTIKATGYIYTYSYLGGIAGYVKGAATIMGCANSGAVTASSDKEAYSGGIAGYVGDAVTIADCTNGGAVTASSDKEAYSGGIAGNVGAATIMGSTNSGTVTASSHYEFSYSGGIAGYVYGATIMGCTNNGAVTSSDYSGGGIAGYVYGATIMGCTNNGAVTSYYYSGGIAGIVSGSAKSGLVMITDCTNSGVVTSSGYSGGIVGNVAGAATITGCNNTATIFAKRRDADGSGIMAGGLIGYGFDSCLIVKESFNMGEVLDSSITTNSSSSDYVYAARSWAGGLAGLFYGTIQDSYNLGKVSAYANNTSSSNAYAWAGGVVGQLDSSSVLNNVYSASTFIISRTRAGVEYAGGIVGKRTSGAIVKNAYYDVNVTRGTNVLGNGLSTANMQCDQFAWQLNTQAETIENSGIWSHTDGYPIFADSVNLPIYRASFDDAGSILNKYTTSNSEIIVLPSDPEPANDSNFAAWVDENGYVLTGEQVLSADLSVSAVYTTNAENRYIVTFEYPEGTKLVAFLTDKNGNLDSLPEAPDADEGYYFKGWFDVNLMSVDSLTTFTENASVNAMYAKLSFPVIFQNADGVTLQSSDIQYGETPAYIGATPMLATTAQYSFTFIGWDATLVPVTDSATYTATYDSTIISYVITFVDEDGSKIESDSVEYGTVPTPLAEPQKASTAQYRYPFAGWTPKIAMVTGDMVYMATYDSVLRSYKVTFLDYDGTVLKEQYVRYGYATTAPADPERDGYEFTGWDKEFDNIVANTEVTAQYEELSSSSVAKSSSSSVKSSSSSEKSNAIAEIANAPFFSLEVVGRTLRIGVAEVGKIYAIADMQGRVLESGYINAVNFNIVLPNAGSYLVRIGNQTRRVNIK